MLKIFIGFDHRQPVSTNVLQHSLISYSSQPLAITPLVLDTLPITRQGLTPFTYTRFLVPWLCRYEGLALFLDADMLALADIAKLFALADVSKSVNIVRNEKRFEWASLILFNCGKCTMLTPEYVEKAAGLHVFDWLPGDEIGDLPPEWNHLVGYDPELENPKLVHYTQGIPAFPETSGCEHADKWSDIAKDAYSTQPWKELMGNSVHAVELTDGRRIPRLMIGEERLTNMMTARAWINAKTTD